MDVRFDGSTVYHLYSSIINKYRESIFSFFLPPLSDDDTNHSDLSSDATNMGHSIDYDPLSYETADTNITATPVSESEAFYRHHLIHNR
jgi:hypothetical protein